MGFNLNETFTDPSKEESGVWVDYLEGSKLLIASKNSAAYKAYLANLARRHQVTIGEKKVRKDTMDLMAQINSDAMAKHLLLDWEGISLNGEEEAPYSYDTGKMVLQRSHELYDFVDNAADDNSRFEIAQEEEVKKP